MIFPLIQALWERAWPDIKARILMPAVIPSRPELLFLSTQCAREGMRSRASLNFHSRKICKVVLRPISDKDG